MEAHERDKIHIGLFIRLVKSHLDGPGGLKIPKVCQVKSQSIASQ